MKDRIQGLGGRFGALAAVLAGAALIRLVAGVAFVNYDTLYALAWGGQLARGETPSYGVPIAPTPHPLLEALGVVLYPLGPKAELAVVLAIAFIALASCGWVVYRLARHWFGLAAGLLAAAVFLTRVPILSYGVRAYLDLPYLALVLGAVLIEVRRPRAGAPVLSLLALAGLLRPEAWAFSGLYWLYLMGLLPERLQRHLPAGTRPQDRREQVLLTLLAGAGPLIWLGSDLAVTGRPLWSLTNTRHTASILDRETGPAKVPEYIPRRIGEILRPAGLVAAGAGGLLALGLLRRRALPGALIGLLAVAVFAAFATVGLPINSRYAFLASAILCIFCGAGLCGWSALERSDPWRRRWLALACLLAAGFLVFAPSQYRLGERDFGKLARQERAENDLTALVRSGAVNLRCGPVGVPNHAPVPLLAVYLKADPARIQSPEAGAITRGVYVDPASSQVEKDYALDRHDPHERASIPPGFHAVSTNRSWLVFERCD